MDCSLPGLSIRGIFQKEYWRGLRFPLQGIFLTQGSNPDLPHCGHALYHLSHQGSPVPKKGNAKENSNYYTLTLISRASKVILKNLQARLQQYMNDELQMFKLDLEKAEEPDIKLPTSIGSWESKRVPKNLYFCFFDYSKAFDCVDHNKL